MTFSLAKPYSSLWQIVSGRAMVVTDLHGDGDAYLRYRDRFLELHANGEADCLIIAGDLLHQRSPNAYDASLDIVVDLLKLRAQFGDAIIVLCGNHELPHIYSFSLSQRGAEFTATFEFALSESPHRAAVTEFLLSLPLFLRTAAGVSLTHAGAADSMTEFADAQQVFEWDHRTCLERAALSLTHENVERLRGAYARMSSAESYDELVSHYLAVEDRDDPRYDNLLRGFCAMSEPGFDLVYNALFSKCERSYGDEKYEELLELLLRHLSHDYTEQRVLIAGHMKVEGGHVIVAGRHLRLASAHHARPRTAGQYLLFDTARPVQQPVDLLDGLGSVFG